ncbi:MAG: acetyl-CoA C-acyltransferase [Pseudomonadota bacterium]
MSSPVYILSAARTPIGSFQGGLATLSAPALGAHAIRAALDAAHIEPVQVDEGLMGNVIGAGVKQAPARQALRSAGLPDACSATTINKVCGSGMKATMLAADQIAAGNAHCMISGGMESMSNAPYLLPKARSGQRMGHGQTLDAMFLDGLEDADSGRSMGSFADATAAAHQLSRERQDAFAIESVTRAKRAIQDGSLAAEIAPVAIGAAIIEHDEQPGRSRLEKIPTLRPAFSPDGTVTAANASSISDGASALVLTRDVPASREPLARIAGHHTHSIAPADFTLAPVGAIRGLLAKLDWSVDSVDLFEINEAFAMVVLLAIDELGLDAERVNRYGGSCAQGHPIGSTGSRLIVTLAHAMARFERKRGIAALCIGGGEATAIALERD